MTNILIEAELVGAGRLPQVLPAWDALARRAAEPNAFYNPETVLAAFTHLPERHGASLLLAWQRGPDGDRLVGALPLVRSRGRYLNPLPVRRAAGCYGTLSTPLLCPDHATAALGAMLAAARRAGVAALAFEHLHENGPVAAALAAVVGDQRLPVVQIGSHRRAMLRTELPFDGYLCEIMDGRRRKDAERRRRRLAEQGALAFRVSTGPDDAAAALERLLNLEMAGWKGRRGTALAMSPDAGAFVRDLVRRGASADRVRVAELTVDGRPVASGLILTAGRRAFFFKTAYDETMARFSPGVTLTLDITAHLLADETIDDADSIAVADHPMIDKIWNDRFPVAAILVGTRPDGGGTFRAASHVERAREALRARLKARWQAWQAARNERSGAPA